MTVNNQSRRAVHFIVLGALPPHDTNVLWLDTSNIILPVLKIFWSGAWVPLTGAVALKAGENIIITDNVISAIQPDVSNFVTTEVLENDVKDLSDRIEDLLNKINGIPTVKHELIYSDDNETLTTHQLMYTEGLVVDTSEDLDRCKLSADVALSEVIQWHRFGSNEKEQWYEYETRKDIDPTLAEFTFKGETQDYIFNHTNPSNTTGFISPKEYSDYDVFVSMGILNSKKDTVATDYIGYIAAVKYDSAIPKYWGLSISAHTMSDGDRLNRSGQSTTKHTISVQGWIQENETGLTTSGVSLLSTADGNLIIPYDENYNNNNNNHQASSMLCRIKRKGSIINAWFSDPYYTNEEEGDAVHMSELHYDRTLTIDLANYTVSFIDLNGSLHSTSYANNDTVVEIFDNIASSARRGYEQRSNPGSIFRLCNTDEIILDVTPGEDKVYKYNNGDWEILNTTPQIQLKSGSRIAWNRITDKLFYNDGSSIYRISAVPEIPQGAEYTAGDNITISPNKQISAIGYTYDQTNMSFAEGIQASASGSYSHAEGYKTNAEGEASHAEGLYSEAAGEGASARGISKASGLYSTAEGSPYENNNIGTADFGDSHIAFTFIKKTGATDPSVGNLIMFGSISSYSQNTGHIRKIVSINGNQITIDHELEYTTTGDITTPNWNIYLLKNLTEATGLSSHAEGCSSQAKGPCSHAEGQETVASNKCSHAEGCLTEATGLGSHAECLYSEATGTGSHAEGQSTKASGYCAHAEGYTTTASGYASHTEGHHTVATGYQGSHAEGFWTTASDFAAHAEGHTTHSNGKGAHTEGIWATASNFGAHAEGAVVPDELVYEVDHISGGRLIYPVDFSTVSWEKFPVGSVIIVSTSPFNIDNFFVARVETISEEKQGQETINKYIIINSGEIEGLDSGTTWYVYTTKHSTASGVGAHAEGGNTDAAGHYSHAEGLGTIAQNDTEHAEGKYNVSHSGTISSIGTGLSDDNRVNAVEVMQNADVYIKGIGGYDGVHIKSETGYENTKTLQEYIALLEARISALEGNQSQ